MKGQKSRPTRAKGRKATELVARDAYKHVRVLPGAPPDQPYFDIARIRGPNAVFEVLADAIRLLADALRVGRITPGQLAERLLEVEGAVRERAR